MASAFSSFTGLKNFSISRDLSCCNLSSKAVCCSWPSWGVVEQEMPELAAEVSELGGWWPMWRQLGFGTSFLRFRALALELPVGCKVTYNHWNKFTGTVVAPAAPLDASSTDGEATGPTSTANRLEGAFRADMSDAAEEAYDQEWAILRENFRKSCSKYDEWSCKVHAEKYHGVTDYVHILQAAEAHCDPGEIEAAKAWVPNRLDLSPASLRFFLMVLTCAFASCCSC